MHTVTELVVADVESASITSRSSCARRPCCSAVGRSRGRRRPLVQQRRARLLHRRHRRPLRLSVASSGRASAAQEVELVQQQVLGDDLLRRHVGDADQRQHLVRPAGGEQRRRQLQRVGGDDVVVGEAVDQQQRAGQLVGEREQRAGVVDVGLRRSGRRGSARCSACRTAATRSPARRRWRRGRRRGGAARRARRGSRRSSSRGWRRGRGRGTPSSAAACSRASIWSSSTAVARSRWTARSHVGAAPGRAPPVGDDDGEALVGEPLRRRGGRCATARRAGACGPPYGSSSTGSGEPSWSWGSSTAVAMPARRRRTSIEASARRFGVAASDVSSTPSSVVPLHAAARRASPCASTTVPPPAAAVCTPGSSVSAASPSVVVAPDVDRRWRRRSGWR